MSKFTNQPLLDAATLRQMDEDFRAGRSAEPHLPPLEPLDPASDPFGMNFEWLEPREDPTPFDLAFTAIATAHPEERFAHVAGDLRTVALDGSLASGTDHEIIGAWAQQNFALLCQAHGQPGTELLAWITTETVPTRDLVTAVHDFLGTQVDFADWDSEKRIAAAMVIMDALRGSAAPPKPPPVPTDG